MTVLVQGSQHPEGDLVAVLDAVEARPDPGNVLICFFSDHGDHHGWQKESFFEAATRVPFLLSWPAALPRGGQTRDDLVSLTDVFGIATGAAGRPDLREGHDVLGALRGEAEPRRVLFGFHGHPGTRKFKAMVRAGSSKLVYLANGGHRLLFDLDADPDELAPVDDPARCEQLTDLLVQRLRNTGVGAALDGDRLWSTPYQEWPRERIYQFDRSRGVTGFPLHPSELA